MIKIEDLKTGFYVASYNHKKASKKEKYKTIVFFTESGGGGVYKIGEKTIYSPKNYDFHYGPLIDSDGEIAIKTVVQLEKEYDKINYEAETENVRLIKENEQLRKQINPIVIKENGDMGIENLPLVIKETDGVRTAIGQAEKGKMTLTQMGNCKKFSVTYNYEVLDTELPWCEIVKPNGIFNNDVYEKELEKCQKKK